MLPTAVSDLFNSDSRNSRDNGGTVEGKFRIIFSRECGCGKYDVFAGNLAGSFRLFIMGDVTISSNGIRLLELSSSFAPSITLFSRKLVSLKPTYVRRSIA